MSNVNETKKKNEYFNQLFRYRIASFSFLFRPILPYRFFKLKKKINQKYNSESKNEEEEEEEKGQKRFNQVMRAQFNYEH